jgi:hypothetical protein
MSDAIKSILHPKERAYRVNGWSGDNWERRGLAPFCSNILAWDTYGEETMGSDLYL